MIRPSVAGLPTRALAARDKKGTQALAGDCPEQPSQVVARSAQHRMQPVTNLALEVTAIHPVIRFRRPLNIPKILI